MFISDTMEATIKYNRLVADVTVNLAKLTDMADKLFEAHENSDYQLLENAIDELDEINVALGKAIEPPAHPTGVTGM